MTLLPVLFTMALVLLSGSPASTFASTAPDQARAQVSYAGVWQGQTGQDKIIKFRINASSHVKSMTVGYKVSSEGCTITGRTTMSALNVPSTPGIASQSARQWWTPPL